MQQVNEKKKFLEIFSNENVDFKKEILAGLLEKKTSNSRTIEKIKALQEELTVLKTLRGNYHG